MSWRHQNSVQRWTLMSCYEKSACVLQNLIGLAGKMMRFVKQWSYTIILLYHMLIFII